MIEFEIGYVWAIYKVANKIDDCKNMKDISLIQKTRLYRSKRMNQKN